eukprot:scaffold13947_cov38-Attheya_sp.AAC.1
MKNDSSVTSTLRATKEPVPVEGSQQNQPFLMDKFCQHSKKTQSRAPTHKDRVLIAKVEEWFQLTREVQDEKFGRVAQEELIGNINIH